MISSLKLVVASLLFCVVYAQSNSTASSSETPYNSNSSDSSDVYNDFYQRVKIVIPVTTNNPATLINQTAEIKSFFTNSYGLPPAIINVSLSQGASATEYNLTIYFRIRVADAVLELQSQNSLYLAMVAYLQDNTNPLTAAITVDGGASIADPSAIYVTSISQRSDYSGSEQNPYVPSPSQPPSENITSDATKYASVAFSAALVSVVLLV
eukprot:TRINITY_DN515_c0_g1_i2.p1 TRINITY_DN515_c0_g1~~TRINITY_DN515_c0_g1_i2.p1  ORF type:complete len:210 (-),score=52.32 TRINITY_DN515_c0_g1_i2:87-716(-)